MPSNPGPGPKAARRVAALKNIRAMFDQGDIESAHAEAKAFLAKHKRDPDGHLLMAVIAERRRDFGAARMHAFRAIKGDATKADACMVLAQLERVAGHTDEALDYCDRALKAAPNHEPFLIQKAGVLEEAGRFDEARAVVDPLIEQFEKAGKPLPTPLRFELAKLLVQEKDYDLAVAVIDELVGEDSTPREMARLMYYLKAKACDRSKKFDEAFAAASLGNEIGLLEFDPALYERQVTALIENWSAARMERFPTSACDDELPVFVAGMPRSGTSLIDQIIDAHPQAAGVGELSAIERFAAELSRIYDPDLEPPECFGRFGDAKWTKVAQHYVREVRALAPPGALRVVNKALGNNKLVGLLALLFPKTRIIHALRDPRDVAISCYMGGFNNRLHAWTTKIDWVANAWEQSWRMMQHWRDALDVPILDVQYEQLVADPDTQFPRLIEFLGLEWDDACREFHASKRTVRTLSYDQVNRPLYTSSSGRYANYAPYIEEAPFMAYPPA